MRKSLPDTGESWEDLDRAMTEIAKSDIDWRRGRVRRGDRRPSPAPRTLALTATAGAARGLELYKSI